MCSQRLENKVRHLLPRSLSQVLAQLRVSEFVEIDAGKIASISNAYPAIVPEVEDPLRPCSVDLVGSAVVCEISPHPVPPESVLYSFTAGGGKAAGEHAAIKRLEENLQKASLLLGDKRSAQPPNSLRALSIRSAHCRSSPGADHYQLCRGSCRSRIWSVYSS